MNIQEALTQSGYYFLTSSSDNPVTSAPVIETVLAALKGGAKVIQYREKRLSPREMFPIALQIRMLTWKYGALFIMNDNIELARQVQADGVHIGQSDTSYSITRQQMPYGIIGVSASTIEQARQAVIGGADYVSASPLFPTTTKIEGNVVPCGLETLEVMRRMMDAYELPRVPIVAIGGIDRRNYKDVVRVGADAICAIHPVLNHRNVVSRVASMTEGVEAARRNRIVYG